MMVGIKKEEWILRIGVSGAFLGHGVFALMGKQSWIPYITAVGISDAAAQTLLPLIGMLDLVVAVLALLWPLRIVLVWATLWGFLTALIRPIAGDPVWDFVERTANFAAPLALLVVQGFPRSIAEFFTIRSKKR